MKKYVQESGLPGRTSKDEFTILLADIEPETANLIAEKVRNGVEKLRFVSSKNGTKLPVVTFKNIRATFKMNQHHSKNLNV